MIQLLLILMTNAGRLEDRKKKARKKTNKQTKKRKVRPLMDFVIMENEIRAASKHVPDVQKMAIALSTRAQLFKRWIPLGYPSDKSLSSG